MNEQMDLDAMLDRLRAHGGDGMLVFTAFADALGSARETAEQLVEQIMPSGPETLTERMYLPRAC